MKARARSWLEHLDGARRQALRGDAEGVHQVRVAARRLRVLLRLAGGHRRLREELRWLRGALAELRDLDVFGSVLLDEVAAALRGDATATARAALESKRYRRLRAKLERVKVPGKRRATKRRARLEARLEALRARDEAWDGEALHDVRRALRRLRYANEWLGLDAAPLAAEQDLLGVQCDLLALEAFSRRHGAEVPEALRGGIARGFALLSEHWAGRAR